MDLIDADHGTNLVYLPSGKLTWQWKMDLLKMYSLLKMGIFYCHVSLLEGTYNSLDFIYLVNVGKFPYMEHLKIQFHGRSCREITFWVRWGLGVKVKVHFERREIHFLSTLNLYLNHTHVVALKILSYEYVLFNH